MADEPQHFSVFATWSGDGSGCGTMKLPQGDLAIPIGGAKALGGCGVGTNPEELLLAGVAACFVSTWAIFLKKLDVGYSEPSVSVTGELGQDPAGGFKMLSASIRARVPAALLAEKRPAVEKTLQLAEKYCIISKVAKAAMPVSVAIEEV
jgi:organic hydroperoxide reductase OsmC/OhrA